MYLLDTDALSELRKRRSGRIDPAFEAWVGTVDQAELFVSVITIAQFEVGIAQFKCRDPHQAAVLRRWLHEKVLPTFVGRILPIDTATALRRARLYNPETMNEHDAWLAATSLVHGLTIVTRTVAAFVATGTTLLDPWTPGIVRTIGDAP